ncbi:MAG: T9SS type A sorting domain-containing protein [Bacteroidia bacterium]|nr:T9SS type A sorting domain-containing protein [Bacteroidia bacterium]
MIKKICTALYLILPVFILAQSSGGIGTWRVHLPYWQNKTIAAIGSTVYVGSSSSVFAYNEAEKELERISKVNGLSDVEVKLLRSNPNNKLLFIVYENGNIDLLQNDQITNMPQIFQRNVIGKKAINDVTFYNGKAYLACSFGIVVIDINKKQIVDSYQNIGAKGSNIEILDIAVLDNFLYASTYTGIYRASLNSGNLSDFNFWSLIKSSSKSNKIEAYNGILYAEVDSVLNTFSNNTWTPINDSSLNNTFDLVISNNKLIVTTNLNVSEILANNTITKTGKAYKNSAVQLPNNRFATVDNFAGIQLFPGGEFNGSDFIYPNGPYNKIATDFKFINGKLYAASGYAPFFNESFRSNGLYIYENNNWTNTSQGNAPITPSNIRDLLTITYDDVNDKLFAASYGSGLVKMDMTGRVEKVYDKNNSILQEAFAGSCRVAGLAFDTDKNLWFTNHSSGQPICVLRNDGVMQCFSVGNVFSGSNYLSALTIDDENQKWIAHTRNGGLLVFNDGGDIANPNNDAVKVLTKDIGNGALASNQVNCITKDKRGEMWIGTSEGLSIFSSPELIFGAGDASFDSRQIVIKTGLVFSNFLGGENINCITVDGANRKWIGTNNGVWLVSSDGYTVIHNFTTKNSPLLDNYVLSVGIDNNTGEVFFGTLKGINSFMGNATESGPNFQTVEVFPNPVRPNFTGDISIKGLAENVNVKITDIAGNLVAETTSNGGFATWNGRNFSGSRVATGVYLIFAANKDGSKSIVSKVAFIN